MTHRVETMVSEMAPIGRRKPARSDRAVRNRNRTPASTIGLCVAHERAVTDIHVDPEGCLDRTAGV